MAWLICIACHHIVKGRGLPRKGKLTCSGCGGHVARQVKVLHNFMCNGGQMPKDVAKKLVHGGLVSVARERHYGPGWIAHKFRAIFDHWPPRQLPEPNDPNGELLWWIKKQSKAYAKQKRAEEAATKPAPKPEAKSALMSADDWEADL